MASAPPADCPLCGGDVAPGTIECPHCGERLIGNVALPADADSLRHELTELNNSRRRNNILGFALGLPGLILQGVGGVMAGSENVLLVGLVLQALGYMMLASGLYFVARYKGRNGAWALLSLIGCIGLLVLLFLKDYNAARIKEIESALRSLGRPVPG